MHNTRLSGFAALLGLGIAFLPAGFTFSVAYAQARSASVAALSVPAAPQWDRGLLKIERACAYCDLDDQTRSRILGFGTLGSAELESSPAETFRKSGADGRTSHYRTSDFFGSSRRVDGYFSFASLQGLPPLTHDTSSGIPSDAQAIARAKELAAQLGLLTDEVSSIEAHGIAIGGRSLLGPIEPVTIGRMVEFKRTVGGYRVLGSSVRFEFGKDMKVQRALIHWPRFRMRPELTRMRDRASVLDEIAQKTANSSLTEMEIVYAQGDDGFMAPAIVARTRPARSEGSADGTTHSVGMPQQHVVLLAE